MTLELSQFEPPAMPSSSVGLRRLLAMLAHEPMPVGQLEHLGMSKLLNRGLVSNYVDIKEDIAFITATGQIALRKPHMTPKKVLNLLVAAKAALEYIQVVKAPPVGLAAQLSAAIADIEGHQ